MSCFFRLKNNYFYTFSIHEKIRNIPVLLIQSIDAVHINHRIRDSSIIGIARTIHEVPKTKVYSCTTSLVIAGDKYNPPTPTGIYCPYLSFTFQYKCDLDPRDTNKCIKSEGIQGGEAIGGTFVMNRFQKRLDCELFNTSIFENQFQLSFLISI